MGIWIYFQSTEYRVPLEHGVMEHGKILMNQMVEHIREIDYQRHGFYDIQGNTYYFDENGEPVTGLCQIDEDHYYFDDTHKMVKHQIIDYNHENQAYRSYFDDAGKRVMGDLKIDGILYSFDENGNYRYSYAELSEGIQNIVNKYGGSVSVYFEDLSTNQVISLNDRTYYPCCMIKTLALASVYEQIDKGNLNYNDHAFWIEHMITISDNTSYNALMRVLGNGDGVQGLRYPNAISQKLGLDSTSLHHGLRPGNYYFTDGSSNVSCAADIGKFFSKLYHGEVVSKTSSDAMLQLFKRCADRDEIQAGLPWNIEYAHKTGNAYALYHDGGIVYLPQNEYVLVIFSDQVSQYEAMMAEVSRYVYQYQSAWMI